MKEDRAVAILRGGVRRVVVRWCVAVAVEKKRERDIAPCVRAPLTLPSTSSLSRVRVTSPREPRRYEREIEKKKRTSARACAAPNGPSSASSSSPTSARGCWLYCYVRVTTRPTKSLLLLLLLAADAVAVAGTAATCVAGVAATISKPQSPHTLLGTHTFAATERSSEREKRRRLASSFPFV